ncbi:allophanate hydrolase-related protein [Occultella gossypii]|uniref:Gamma-glutamylcyclotransferase n=1 Tax=Occultella gossypii TaxID=2800820 RepID=A0ABS7S633_9MICO|nr:gamma-glutamylcyclotransferase [Occultella gossypii]MBZ2195814.1 gamma-glutamylcyclotransferase [Occultella gossypii]
MTELFVNGEGMRGGGVHHNIAGHPFLGSVRTAPGYRFFSVRDEFPGIAPGGTAAIVGELYDVPLAVLAEKFLPDEPPELELGVIRLEDGRAVLSMVLRPEEVGSGRHTDISAAGGWRAYRGA